MHIYETRNVYTTAEKLKKRKHSEDLRANGKTILKYTLRSTA
jgi:hypothetical protein